MMRKAEIYFDRTLAGILRQNSAGIPISSAQFKQSLTLEKNTLRFTKVGESGQFILKPIPFRVAFGKVEELPANEHLTMQIAKQVYGIRTAESALVFFKMESPLISLKDLTTIRGIIK